MTVVRIIIILNSVLNVKIQTHEEKYEPPVELQKTTKIILIQEEYDKLKTAFCTGKG
jgi:hypothetical protein